MPIDVAFASKLCSCGNKGNYQHEQNCTRICQPEKAIDNAKMVLAERSGKPLIDGVVPTTDEGHVEDISIFGTGKQMKKFHSNDA